jgi:hypothetical protein
MLQHGLERGRKGQQPIAANTLKWTHYSFRGRISGTQTIFPTPSSATNQQLIDL